MKKEQTSETATSADIKKQIDEATKSEKGKTALKESGLPLTAGIADQINASESTPKALTPIEVKPESSSKDTMTAKGTEAPSLSQEDIEAQDWARKKGINWVADPSVLKAMHKSDILFHEHKQKEANERRSQPNYAPPPVYSPPPPVYQPSYAPPVNNRQVLENLGRQYNMPPEDVERLMKFNADYFQVASQADRARFEQELQTIKREEQKNSAFRELSSDPALKNQEVASEFARLLTEYQTRDPQSFENDPNAYMKVRDAAIINIARRNLTGQPLQEGVPLTPRPPTMPPPPIGKGSGGGSTENESGFDREAFFKLKTPEEKKAVFEKMGLVSQY